MGPKSPLILRTHKPRELNRQKAKLSSKSFQTRLLLSGASDYELSATRLYQLPSAEKYIDSFFWGEPSEEKNVTILAGRRRRFFGFVEVGDDMNSFLRDSHLYMLGPLSLTKGYPSGGISKSTDGADTPKDESHHAADEATVPPASGLECRPEVAMETSFARLAVIEKKAVGAGHPIIVKVVNEGDFELKSGLIDGRGETGQGILYHPKIKVVKRL